MNRLLIKILSAVLMIAMMVPILASCKHEIKKAGDSSTDDSNITGESNDDEYIKDSLPQLDYNQSDIKVLTWQEQSQWDWNFDDDYYSGNISKALYERQTEVQNRLNVRFDVLTELGAYAYRTQYVEKIRSIIFSGNDDSFSMIGLHPASAAAATISGYLYDLTDDKFKYLDFAKPWWPDDIVESCTINDNLYFATGDISTTAIRSISCMILNLDIFNEHYEENIYDIIDNGTWTLEEFEKLSVGVFGDGGDSNYYSTTITSHVEFDNLFYGAGFKYIRHNSDGKITISQDMSEQRLNDWFEACQSLLYDNWDVALTSIEVAFASEYSMWHMGYISDIQDYMGEVSFNFAIAPYPKYDESQEKYCTVNGWWLTSYGVPINVDDCEKSSAVMEALASSSYRTVTPAVYKEAFQYRYLDTEENAAVFDLLHDTLVFDTGRFFVDQLGKIGYAFRQAAIENQSWISYRDQNMKGWSRELTSLLKSLK